MERRLNDRNATEKPVANSSMPWKRSGNEVERGSMCVSCVISRGYDDRVTKNDAAAEKKEGPPTEQFFRFRLGR